MQPCRAGRRGRGRVVSIAAHALTRSAVPVMRDDDATRRARRPAQTGCIVITGNDGPSPQAPTSRRSGSVLRTCISPTGSAGGRLARVRTPLVAAVGASRSEAAGARHDLRPHHRRRHAVFASGDQAGVIGDGRLARLTRRSARRSDGHVLTGRTMGATRPRRRDSSRASCRGSAARQALATPRRSRHVLPSAMMVRRPSSRLRPLAEGGA